MSRWAAYNLFGSMRHSTPSEQKEYERMLEKHSTPFGRSIWDMSDIEMDYCDVCHQYKQVQRKYYHYPLNCECCGGQYHFEIVKYCNDCEPKPPKWIMAQAHPIEREENSFHPEHWDYYN